MHIIIPKNSMAHSLRLSRTDNECPLHGTVLSMPKDSEEPGIIRAYDDSGSSYSAKNRVTWRVFKFSLNDSSRDSRLSML